MRVHLLSLAAGAALLACKATDLAQAGGLSSDNPQTADETQLPETQPSETQPEPQPAPTETAAPETQQPAPEKAPEAKPAAKPKAKTKAKAEPVADVGDTVAAALSDGFHAVVWCGAGHEQFRPQDIVMVQDEAYKSLRAKGHARDAEESELAAAIKAGKTIHWH